MSPYYVAPMNPFTIQVPQVTDGVRYPHLYALYLHSTAALLRAAVSYFNGAHTGFDIDLVLKTPGLGNGTVSISVCLPPPCKDKSVIEMETSSPLVLVLEGGGFVLGQPKDGKKNDRLVANEVLGSHSCFAFNDLQPLTMVQRLVQSLFQLITPNRPDTSIPMPFFRYIRFSSGRCLLKPGLSFLRLTPRG
jgi:hypothetical protein